MFNFFRKKKIQQMYIGMNYINGEWCAHHPDFSSLNPCTEFEVGLFPLTDATMIDEAVDAARCAFPKWRAISRVQRADYFDKLAQLVKRDHDKLVKAISQETGKNLNESHAEVIEALHMCQYVAGTGRQPCGDVMASELSSKDAYVMRKPKGVVGVISPWNFPLAIGSFWCSAPAIVEGNCVVHKPSEYTPMVAQMACELYDEAGFPPGVYNLIHGFDHAGKTLVRDPHVDCILFTGSAEAGRDIRQHCASTWNKTCSCEMGSKSAVIVFEDGNHDLAVTASIASAFKLSGQRCVSASRIFVQRSNLVKFTQDFISKAASLNIGDPFEDAEVFYGPLINRDAVKKVTAYNEMVLDDKHANVRLFGGKIGKDGFFMAPFVYVCEWADKRYLKEEVFGPHVAIIPFDTIDDVISYYNDTEYGLALGVITDDFRKMRRIRDECNAGMIYLNGGSIAAESHMPFGGIGKSGNGYKSASGTYKAVTEEVAVTLNYEKGISWAQGMK